MEFVVSFAELLGHNFAKSCETCDDFQAILTLNRFIDLIGVHKLELDIWDLMYENFALHMEKLLTR